MSGHRSFNTLRQRMSPERRAANEAAAVEMHREYALNEIRREMGLTQAELADRLDISQPSFAACEKSDNMRIGTLRRIVEAMGGVLSLNVSIDGRNYCLSQPHFA